MRSKGRNNSQRPQPILNITITPKSNENSEGTYIQEDRIKWNKLEKRIRNLLTSKPIDNTENIEQYVEVFTKELRNEIIKSSRKPKTIAHKKSNMVDTRAQDPKK